jgi:hypothetical protein
MSQLGLGAMITLLGGNEDSVNAYTSSLGKKIVALKLDDDANSGDGALIMTFADDTQLKVYDLSTDDDLTHYVNSKLKSIETSAADTKDDEDNYGVTEMMFVHVKTTKGTFVINSYNSHNGYYGGICIRCSSE